MHERSFEFKLTIVCYDIRPYVDPVYSYTFGRSTSYLSYTTIGNELDKIAFNFPDHDAVISRHQGIRKTYRELMRDVNRFAKALINDLGIKRGDVVGMWSVNVYEFFVVQFALAKIGAIYCAVSPLYKSGELEHLLNQSGMKALVFPGPGSFQSLFIPYESTLDAAKKTHLKDLIYLENESGPGTGVGGIRSHSLKYLIEKNDENIDPEIMSVVSPDDVANIFYTSGTTGKPKGAATSHATVMNCQHLMLVSKRDASQNGIDSPRACVPLPYFHGFAGFGVYCMAAIPFTQVIFHYKFVVEDAVDAMLEEKCTDLSAVPTMAMDLISYCKSKNIKIDSMKNIVVGAAHAPPAVIQELHDIFPNLEHVMVGYGATETSPVATFPAVWMDQTLMNTTTGSVIDFGSIKIVDNNGRLVKHNETGEILVRGLLMDGYWNEPEKTKEVLNKGWYKTGDLGTLDKEGYVRITGRTKEMIIRGGANIYPREVEDLLHQHPAVEKAGVCGVPHQRLGEEVCAWIKLKQGFEKTTAEDIKEFCADKISKYKIPAHVLFVNDFPMTPSMKMQKFLMTEQSIQILKQK